MSWGAIPLTARQAEVLAFIASYSLEKGWPPTRDEIREWFGWASVNAAEDHIKALERKGRLKVTPGISRGLTVLPQVAA